jgi:hypothetical protein
VPTTLSNAEGKTVKLNEPISKEDHSRADDEYRCIAADQIESIKEIADLITAGETLNGYQTAIAAAILREAAKKRISHQRKHPAGHRQKIPDVARLWYARLIVHQKMSETAALKVIANQYDVTLEAVKRKMGKLGTENERHLATLETRKAFLLAE